MNKKFKRNIMNNAIKSFIGICLLLILTTALLKKVLEMSLSLFIDALRPYLYGQSVMSSYSKYFDNLAFMREELYSPQSAYVDFTWWYYYGLIIGATVMGVMLYLSKGTSWKNRMRVFIFLANCCLLWLVYTALSSIKAFSFHEESSTITVIITLVVWSLAYTYNAHTVTPRIMAGLHNMVSGTENAILDNETVNSK